MCIYINTTGVSGYCSQSTSYLDTSLVVLLNCLGVFDDDDVTHVEGDVNPVRDIEIIHEELRLKVCLTKDCKGTVSWMNCGCYRMKNIYMLEWSVYDYFTE
jgi:hypothetical protein